LISNMTESEKNTGYFISGGAGFIGSHLVARLLAENNSRVTVYDNLVSGKKENIASHLGNGNLRFIEADLLDYATLARAMKGHDTVWHLGANTDIPGGNKVTDLDLKNCTTATRNVLEAMRANGIKSIIFSSTSCVYGDAPPVSLSETYGPLLPISLYGSGKLACEALISAYSHLFNIRALMFRFGNVVGARMGHGVIYDFIQKLRKNPRELEILGDGKQEKPFFLVEDCIEGMLHAFRHTNAPYDVYNLGSGNFTNVTRIAEIVAGVMGIKNVRFRYSGGKRGWPGDVPVVHLNVNKIKALGWQAGRTSDEAVRIAAQRLLETV
jgi:UDP-glucose 4-epimerase